MPEFSAEEDSQEMQAPTNRTPILSRSKIKFWLDGICSDDLGIVVSNFPRFSSATPNVTLYSIPGRAGSLTRWDGTWGNVSGEIDCYVADLSRAQDAVSAVNDILCSSGGNYVELVTSDDVSRSRRVRLTNFAQASIRMKTLAPFTLKFSCMPQVYYRDEVKATYTAPGGKIYNPTQQKVYPQFRMYRNSGSITGDYIFFLKHTGWKENSLHILPEEFNGKDYVDIYCESRFAILQGGDEAAIFVPDLYLAPGENEIAFSDGGVLSSVDMSVRWWTL